jgi:DNA polymerase-3 subunit gamma/tau
LAEQGGFIVTARKWRPLRFGDVVGQGHITSTLKNAIKNNRIHHAYLFCGPRGVGKTTTARILAKAVNCLNPQDFEPCNECKTCTSVLSGSSLDVIEIDGASNNSVDDIRKLRENAKYPPSVGKHKMYIIDEVHMLSTAAFNALLKTLEEPPPHLLFVFATTEAQKVPATIISRTQKFDFRRMEIPEITGQLKSIAEKENITIDEQSLITIALKGDGSMRDAQSIFDQAIAFCGNDVGYGELADALNLIDENFFFRMSAAIYNNDHADMLEISSQVIKKGYDLQETLLGLLKHFRNLITVKVTGNTDLIESSDEILKKYTETAEKFENNDILRIMSIINEAEQQVKFASQPRVKFEFTLLKLAALDKAIEIETLLKEIAALKKNSLADGAPIASESRVNYSAGTKVPGKEANAQPVAQHGINPADANRDIDARELSFRWDNFVKHCVEKDSRNFSFLRNQPVKFEKNKVLFICDEKFRLELIQKKVPDLEFETGEFFSNKVNIEVKLNNPSGESEKNPPEIEKTNPESIESNKLKHSSTSENLNKTEPADYSNLHPAEKMLREMFNAEEM